MSSIELDAKVLKQLMDTSPAAMFIVDKQRNMLFANKSYADMFGYTQEEVVNVNARKFHIDDESFEKFGKLGFEAVKKGKPVEIEFRGRKKDGSVVWVHVAGSLVPDCELILWTMIDITKRKEIEHKLEETNYNLQHYLDAIDNIELGLFVVDEDYKIRYMNNTMIDWFGDHEGKICYSAIANLDEPCSYCKIHDVIVENKKVIYEPTTPDGQSFDIVATSIRNSDGSMSKMEVIRNITEKKKVQKDLMEQKEMLYHQANYDPLTGLANRMLFSDRLSQAIKKAKRKKKKMALFYIDLDNFKEINDSLGHAVGDEVLKEVATRLKNTIRSEDTLARLGGDEFSIIVEGLKQIQDTAFLARKILDILADPIKIDEHELYVSSSIGISVYPDDGIDAQNLLKYADSAMYKAKAEGRNNFQYYSSEMTELAFERVVMEANLRMALQNNDFIVYYQLQVDSKNETIIGMEALVRWKHISMGIVPPTKFVPIAERTGLIVELDRFVMRTAMREFAKWYEDGLNPGILSMNLAMKQLQEDDFIDVFTKMLKDSGCKPEWIELEVTETQVMKDPKKAIEALDKIHSLGVRLAVDDFGTGYSSLSYLKKLPINKLKIDQSFVRELPESEEDGAIVRAIIALAKSLNLSVLAEGIENTKQKDFLLKSGCSNIQGYLYSRPLPKEDIDKLLVSGVKL